MRTITVEVTQADIDNGERNHCAQCPVALALNRATGKQWHIGRIFAHEIDRPTRLDIPYKVRTFIDYFDSGGKPAPFTFTLEVPE